ncbi:Rib/alpha-like domain-containing protein [Corynebacterium propinquum]|uniref:Rib/alpha-like domain-containing protein n=2 Tax=Corynebacterium propinquum TaxID=43769 RepID=UPI00254281EB|nr:Rib/alpha-like domain-containing protein [Corynebacterium propinquum]MDK4251624.1 Rib/alpha-like domain-containing protein [Corynebacterium propinquum]
MNHRISANKTVRRKGVTIAAAALSVALVAPFAQSVAYPEISAAARAVEGEGLKELGSKKLEVNPPTFYANTQRGGRYSGTGILHMRTTGILAGTFFPEGTKFELQDPTWAFSRAVGEQDQYKYSDTVGWGGVRKHANGEINNRKSDGTGPSVLSNAPSNTPYVVADTGQVLFALGGNPTDGARINVPMKAVYEDVENKRKYVWTFELPIQIGNSEGRGEAANKAVKPANMKDPVFVEGIPAENLRQQGKVNFGTGAENFQGWYTQSMGVIGRWIERSNIPKHNINVAHPELRTANDVEPIYGELQPGAKKSDEPTFQKQGDPSTTVGKPSGTKFSLASGAQSGAKIDPDTGVVSFDTPVGAETTVQVVATYSDGSSDTADVVFKPVAAPEKKKADELAPSYKPFTVELGDSETVEAPTFDKVETQDVTEADPAPSGTTFKPGDLSKLPDGLSATVKDDGSVELTVGEGVQTGEYKVPVTVTYEDGSEDTAEVSVTVEVKVKDPEPPATAPVADDLGYLQDIHVAPDNYKRSDSTGTPDLPDTIQKQDGDFFRFGELPEGFVRNPNPSWNGVEEIIREGAGESERVLLRINKQNGKVEVNAGPDADYSLQELPVEYADANGNLKGKDTVSVSVRPIAHSWNGEPTESENGSVNVPYTGSKPDLTKDLTPSVTKGDGEAMLDENGNINYTPGEGDRPGDEIEVAITDSEDDHVRDVVFKIPSQSDDYTPEGADVSVFRGQDADEVAGEGVSNKGELPEGTTFAFKGDVDTSTVGTLPEAQTLVVTYPDGSTDEVEVNVHVVDGTEHGWDTDSPVKGNDGDVTVSYTGEGADALGDDAGVEVSNGDGVASLDEDGNVVYTPGAGDKPGDVVQVEVFDGDGDSVGVVEFAIPSFAEQRDPEGQSISVAEGGELDPADAITNKGELPEGTEFEFDGPVDTSTPGDKPAKVIVSYPDGSTDSVEITVTVTEVATQADEFEPKGKTVIVAQGGNPDAAEGIANKGELPAGTEFEFDGPVDTSSVGEKSVKVIVAYPDGSTEAVEVTVQVAAGDQDLLPDAERYEPLWNDTTIEDNSPVTVENKGDELPHGTEVELGWGHGGLNQGTDDWELEMEENGDITVTPGADAQPGDAIMVEVEINYPDGNSETKTFVVQVQGDRDAFAPGNFGELPPLTGGNDDDLTAGDLFTDAPTVNDVSPGDNIISGTGKPGATITVTGPNGFSTTTTVHENGQWSVDLTGGATPGTQFIVSQKDGDKNESDQVLVTVGGDNKPLPNPGSSELPGSSLGSSNFDIPKHLQCAVFAGGVTAIPLILLSPMHNMYEMMINPHLNGLREQFHRELHALDQQVRRGLGVEGHPALQFMDHINARVNEFNQQLGQVAHDNRHIGLAAAAIAVAGLSFQHCMNTQAASSSSVSLVGSSSSSQEQAPARNEAKEDNAGGIVGWFQGLFNRK